MTQLFIVLATPRLDLAHLCQNLTYLYNNKQQTTNNKHHFSLRAINAARALGRLYSP